ncbi:MAG: hypothetical protein ACLQAR_05195 [Steroidobacteraceae bacterium]
MRDLIAAHSWRESIGVVFGPPGWRPGGRGPTSKNIRSDWHLRQAAQSPRAGG